jgi:hypothetical protein
MEQTDLFALVEKMNEGQRGHRSPKPSKPELQRQSGVIPTYARTTSPTTERTTVSFPPVTASWEVASICEFAEAKIREIRLIAVQPLSDWLKGRCIGSSLHACNEAVEHLGQEINRLRKV